MRGPEPLQAYAACNTRTSLLVKERSSVDLGVLGEGVDMHLAVNSLGAFSDGFEPGEVQVPLLQRLEILDIWPVLSPHRERTVLSICTKIRRLGYTAFGCEYSLT